MSTLFNIEILYFPDAEKAAFLLGVNSNDLLKSLLKPKIKVGSEVVTQGRTREQVGIEFSICASILIIQV